MPGTVLIPIRATLMADDMDGPMPSFDVSGKHVLITGATSGLGAMMAAGFAAAGATTYVSARSADACARAARELGSAAVPLPGDVSTEAGCQALAAALRQHTGRLDVLINNAGTTWGGELESYPDRAWDKVLAVNLKGPFQLTVACLPELRTAGKNGGARVINIGSHDGQHVPQWESYAYSSSKAALHHLTRHLAKRLAGEGITVNAIAPGLFESRMTDRALEPGELEELGVRNPLGRTGRQQDIAGAAIFLASPAAEWLTGIVLPVDGGWGDLG